MKSKKCYHCGATTFRRINRTNYLQRRILPWFGYFPWECVMCRKRTFFRDSGHGTAVRSAGLPWK